MTDAIELLQVYPPMEYKLTCYVDEREGYHFVEAYVCSRVDGREEAGLGFLLTGPFASRDAALRSVTDYATPMGYEVEDRGEPPQWLA